MNVAEPGYLFVSGSASNNRIKFYDLDMSQFTEKGYYLLEAYKLESSVLYSYNIISFPVYFDGTNVTGGGTTVFCSSNGLTSLIVRICNNKIAAWRGYCATVSTQ